MSVTSQSADHPAVACRRSQDVSVEGATVGEVLATLAAYPGLSGQVIDDQGTLHKFVNVYVNDDESGTVGARHAGQRRGRVSILPAVAGGATAPG